MPHIPLSTIGTTPFEQLLGHTPDTLEKWNLLSDQLAQTNLLSASLKEEVRRVLAHGHGCEYCKAKGKPAENHQHVQTSLAVAFTYVFLKHQKSITTQTFDTLRSEFSVAEIVELCSFICFTTASQTFGAIMDLQ